MDVVPQFSLTAAPLSPGLGSILRPVIRETVSQDLSSLSWAAPSLEAVSLATPQSMVLAQHFDQDVLGDMGKLWNTFIDSGQVWALIIGIAVGYFLRSLTAY